MTIINATPRIAAHTRLADSWLACLGLVVSVWLLTVSPPAQAEDNPWTLSEEKDGIRIFTRPNGQSPYLEIKAAMTINARAEEVAAAFGDGNGCSAWRTMCKSSSVIETVADNERYVHMVLDMPWPISDRDLVMHVTDSLDTNTQQAIVQFTSAAEKRPDEDWVRAQANGQYVITMIDDERVDFIYNIHTDLGGDLSANMINPRVAKSTIEDLKRLRAQAEAR